jgi:predicted ribosomally synthesized peptide with nif11-like leader
VSEDQIKKFLVEIQKNKNLLDQVLSVGTADEIAKIANDSGFKFTGSELKNNDGVRMLIRVIYELITD